MSSPMAPRSTPCGENWPTNSVVHRYEQIAESDQNQVAPGAGHWPRYLKLMGHANLIDEGAYARNLVISPTCRDIRHTAEPLNN